MQQSWLSLPKGPILAFLTTTSAVEMDIMQHHQNVNYMDGSHLPFLHKLSLQIPFPQAPHYRHELKASSDTYK